MKKYLLLFCLSLSCFITTAQVVVWSEDFEGPLSVTSINNDMLTSPISGFNSPDSGFKPMQDFFYLYANAAQSPPPNQVGMTTSSYSPAGMADDWLMTPQMIIPANCYFVWSVRGLQPSATTYLPNGYEVRISTTGISIANYTTTLYSNPWTPYQWWHRYVDLSAYAGMNISIAIRNNTYDGYMMQVDNLAILQLMNYDMSGEEVLTKVGVKQGVGNGIVTRFRNQGNTTVTSLTMNYRVNGGAVVSQPITGLSIPPLEYDTLTHPTLWTPSAAGPAIVEVWASNINGNADLIMANDTAIKTIQVYTDMTVKKPLYEETSSKECGPCAAWNAFIHPFIIDSWNANQTFGNISAIYYQMDFPGVPDPSYNADSETRWVYYGSQALPRHFLDGITDMHDEIFDADWKTPTSYSEFNYSEFPAFIDIDVNASIVGTNVSATVTVNPLQNIASSNLKLHIVVTEDHYSDVPGFNGETDFYFVMRKMLPDATGTSIGPLTQYTPVVVTENYNFTVGGVTSGSFNLWSTSNIRVVAFVQDNVTKEVFQSEVSNMLIGLDDPNEVQTLIYPNPATDLVNVDFDQQLSLVNIRLTNMNGQEVYAKTFTDINKALIDVSHLTPGIYLLNYSGDGFNHTEKIVKK